MRKSNNQITLSDILLVILLLDELLLIDDRILIPLFLYDREIIPIVLARIRINQINE